MVGNIVLDTFAWCGDQALERVSSALIAKLRVDDQPGKLRGYYRAARRLGCVTIVDVAIVEYPP